MNPINEVRISECHECRIARSALTAPFINSLIQTSLIVSSSLIQTSLIAL